MEEQIINVLDDEFETEVLKSDKPVLVDFGQQMHARGNSDAFIENGFRNAPENALRA